MRILISGASVAGPVLTYWLSRYGFDVTVVERAPTLRKTDGHAVDLFRPAMEISAKMGVLPRIEALATGTTRLTLYREGAVLGAYVLAGELARADGDRLRAFAAYELQMREPVPRSRSFARGAAKGLIPGSRAGLWALTRGAQLISAMPASLSRSLAKLNTKGVRMHDSMPVPEYTGSDV